MTKRTDRILIDIQAIAIELDNYYHEVNRLKIKNQKLLDRQKDLAAELQETIREKEELAEKLAQMESIRAEELA